MARIKLDVRPGGRYAFVRTYDLDGVSVRLHFRWLPRISRWLVEVRDVDDQYASLPQLAVSGGRLRFDRRLTTMPGGTLYWGGEDEYGREGLGELVQLYYQPATPVDTAAVIDRRVRLLYRLLE